jgi:3-oxoacyl-[acyl-carrier-protein] synthase-3
LRIATTGRFLPARVVSSDEVDALTGMPSGWTQKHTGVVERRHVGTETAAQMGASALRDALERSPWGSREPDLLLSAGGTPHQPIPCTAALIAAEMGWHGAPCYDVNATCLGFVAALQVAGGLLATGTYRRIAIVCSEIASKGLNWKQPEAAGLMGDGAAAVLVERDERGDSALLHSRIETWPEGAAFTEIRGGGTRLPAREHVPGENTEDFLFHMDGPAVFRLAAEKMEPFVARFIGTASSRWDAVDWVVPHQASLPAVRHLRRRLGIPPGKLVVTIQTQGNVIAASMPLALHEAVCSGSLQRGQCVLLLGTSAGFSLGGVLLRY